MLLQAAFALVVFAITAATIAEANRVKAAVASLNRGAGDVTGVLTAFNFKCVERNVIGSCVCWSAPDGIVCAGQLLMASCWP
jgi:hypothetical protein